MGEHELAKAIVEKILANEHEKMSVYQTKWFTILTDAFVLN